MPTPNTSFSALFAALALAANHCHAAPTLAKPVAEPDYRATMIDNVPMPDYLDLLERVNPIMRASAEMYLAAYRRRCRGEMSTLRLRREVAGNSPGLMSTVRLLGGGDRAGAERQAATVSCTER